MKKVAKAILLAAGILLAVGTAVVVLGVNLYVQSADTRARIERGLSRALHADVKIKNVSFMPWYGVRISGIKRNPGDAAVDGNSLEIGNISVRLRLWRLIRHDVVIKQLTVDDVKVAWSQNADGKWQLPAPPAVPVAVQAPPAPAVETPQSAPQEQPQPAGGSRPVAVDHARMRNAEFAFYDKNHKELASLKGVYVQTPSPSDKLVAGLAAVDSVAIQNAFFITDWRGAFKYTPADVSLFDTSCTVAGGQATGTLDVKIGEQDSPFALDTQFSGVNLEKILADAGVAGVQASGSISGFVHLEGDTRNATHARGKGELVITGGRIAETTLFDSLGLLLNTDKFRDLTLDDAHANFHAEDGKVTLDDLTLKSGILSLASKGVMGADGNNLYLLCRLSIDAKIARQIPDYLLQNFAKDETSGARYIDFPITGDIKHPDYREFLNTIKKHMSLKAGWKALFGHQSDTAPEPASAPPAPVPSPSPTP